MPVTIYLDREIEFDGNLRYYINVVSASGVPSRLPVYPVSGKTNVVSFQNIWDTADQPIPGSVYIIESESINAQLYRVVSISEASSSSGGLEYQVTALKYNASKFAAVEQGLVLEESPTQISPPDPPIPPQRVRGVAYITADGVFKLQASWNYPMIGGSRDPFTSIFLVQYKEGEFGAWSASSTVSGTTYDSGSLPSGTYYIRVAAVNIYDDSSEWVETGEIFFALIPQVIDNPMLVGIPILIESGLVAIYSIQSPISVGIPRLQDNNIVVNTIASTMRFGTPRLQGNILALTAINNTALLGEPYISSGAPTANGLPYIASQSSAYTSQVIATFATLTDNLGTTGGGTNRSTGEWIKADFGQRVRVSGVTVGGGNLPTWGAVAPYLNSHVVQYSSDNSSWTTAFTVTGVTDSGINQFKTFTLESPVEARYWRLAVTTNAWLATTEFRFL